MDAFEAGARLRAARLRQGYTLQELADRVSVSVSSLSGYERGQYEPNASVLREIANALDVSVGHLMGEGDRVDERRLPELDGALRAIRPDAVAERLRAAREERGLTVDDVAIKCGAPRERVMAWEAGERVPRDVEWCRLARVLRKPMPWLSGGVEQPAGAPADIAASAKQLAAVLDGQVGGLFGPLSTLALYNLLQYVFAGVQYPADQRDQNWRTRILLAQMNAGEMETSTVRGYDDEEPPGA